MITKGNKLKELYAEIHSTAIEEVIQMSKVKSEPWKQKKENVSVND